MKAKLCGVALQAEAGGPANPEAAGQPLGGCTEERCPETAPRQQGARPKHAPPASSPVFPQEPPLRVCPP